MTQKSLMNAVAVGFSPAHAGLLLGLMLEGFKQPADDNGFPSVSSVLSSKILPLTKLQISHKSVSSHDLRKMI